MHEEERGFNVSCTFQSKFPYRLTWFLQHLGFMLYANVWPEFSLTEQHQFVSEQCVGEELYYIILCSESVPDKPPCNSKPRIRRSRKWILPECEFFSITFWWRLGQTGKFCIRRGSVHRTCNATLQRAVTISSCVLLTRCPFVHLETLQRNPDWKADNRNQAYLWRAAFSGSADAILFHMQAGSCFPGVRRPSEESLSTVCQNCSSKFC